MSMTDPIADMLARLRNALMARHTAVRIPASKLKIRIAEILKEEGYIEDYSVSEADESSKAPQINIVLKWVAGSPAIEGLKRVSRPGQRQYASSRDIPRVRNGLGILIVSTSRGVMTDRKARRDGVGGELLCSVW